VSAGKLAGTGRILVRVAIPLQEILGILYSVLTAKWLAYTQTQGEKKNETVRISGRARVCLVWFSIRRRRVLRWRSRTCCASNAIERCGKGGLSDL
jgi:hypothetical protein